MKIESGDYLTPKECGNRIGYTHAAIMKAIKTNRLPAVHIGGIYLIKSTANLETNRTGATARAKAERQGRRKMLPFDVLAQGYDPARVFIPTSSGHRIL